MPEPSDGVVAALADVVKLSPLRQVRWRDRGRAPAAFLLGMAVAYARNDCRLAAGDAAVRDMARAPRGDPERDALAWYAPEFAAAGLPDDGTEAGTLRQLFVLMIGLAMRESSGRHCEGRDRAAENTTADTAEAGLFQASWNARTAHPLLPGLLQRYAGSTMLRPVFSQGIRCGEGDAENFGAGEGRDFQALSKDCPAFAIDFAGLALRHRRKHWGPLNNRHAEVLAECDALLRAAGAAAAKAGGCIALAA